MRVLFSGISASGRAGSCQRQSLLPTGTFRQAVRSRHLSSSAVATSSRVTLAHPVHSSAHRQLVPSPFPHQWQGRRFEQTHVRGLATMTRRPEKPEDPEVFSDDGEPGLILTDSAIKQLTKVAEKEHNDSLALRIAVEPGGCHGYQYKMELTDEVEEDDFRFSVGEKAHLLVDSMSLRLIKGSTVDYVTELIGSQFAIFHNPQAKGAGCGCGVSWEPNI